MLSNESSETLDSFIHLNASSFESHSTTVSPNMNQGTAWRQGRRPPVETSATYNRTHLFAADPRSSKGNRPTAWRFSSLFPQQRLGSPDLTNSDAERPGRLHLSSPNHNDYRTESEVHVVQDGQSTKTSCFLAPLRLCFPHLHPTRMLLMEYLFNPSVLALAENGRIHYL